MADWKKGGIRFAALLSGSFLAASPSLAADGPVMPPLSQYRILKPPPLQIEKLSSATRPTVEAALKDAENGRKAATLADDIVRTALRSADKGREAARRAHAGSRGYGKAAITFKGKPCSYSGELKGGFIGYFGVLSCQDRTIEGSFNGIQPDLQVVEKTSKAIYAGSYKDGGAFGYGADYHLGEIDSYQGEYRDSARMGFGVERDKDGVYPGRFGFYADPKDPAHRINMILSGRQDFPTAHWAGRFGAYLGPKIACTIIKGAYFEGAALDGAGAKFDAGGKITEQGPYKVGILKDGGGPPC
jgi:hypothetical protein